MSKVNKRAPTDALSEITIWWNFTTPLEPILVQNAKNCEPRRLPQTVDAALVGIADALRALVLQVMR